MDVLNKPFALYLWIIVKPYFWLAYGLYSDLIYISVTYMSLCGFDKI